MTALRLTRVSLALTLTALFAACATPTPPPAQQAGQAQAATYAPPYRFVAGDKLGIEVYDEPDLSSEDVLVEPDGSIKFPLLGRVPVAGRTPSEVEQMLEKQLRNGYLVDPNVRVSASQLQPVYVNGQVAKTGPVSYTQGLNIQQAISLAGGRTRLASSKVYLQRRGMAREQAYRVTEDTLVYPGDIIIVEERLF